LERPASAEPERLGQGGVEGGAVGMEQLLHRHLGRGLFQQALQPRQGGVKCWRRGVGCRSLSVMRLRCDITTNTSGVGPVAGPTVLLDRPLLRAESPPAGASTAPQALANRLSARLHSHPWLGSRGNQRLCNRCCRLLLLRPRDRGRGVRRLASRRHTCCRP
jgi:hypothetical protein